MFHPAEHPMKRGWVGRIDGEHVIHLAAQTMQAFFTGGGSAREHAVYSLAAVRLLAPVLHPPSVRIFESESSFEFANPAAIVGPGAKVGGRSPSDKLSQGTYSLVPGLAAVIGADGALGGFTALAGWRLPALPPPKDRDFALGLGPVVVTPDELEPTGLEATVRVDGEERARTKFPGFDWTAARDLAADGTVLRPGDLVAASAADMVEDISPGSAVELEVDGIGVLAQKVLPD
jgi:hypothetical protein